MNFLVGGVPFGEGDFLVRDSVREKLGEGSWVRQVWGRVIDTEKQERARVHFGSSFWVPSFFKTRATQCLIQPEHSIITAMKEEMFDR